MEVGAGIWVRILDGTVVSQRAFESTDETQRSRFQVVAVPRITWLQSDNAERDVELMMRVSTIDVDSQLASLSFDGRDISKSELIDQSFAVDAAGQSRRHLLHAHLFPAEVCQMAAGIDEALATRIEPLAATHLVQIFGTCRLPATYLDEWNGVVRDSVLRLRRAGDAALLLDEEQQRDVVQRGLVPSTMFEPAPPPDLSEQPLEFEWDQPEENDLLLPSPAPIVRPTTFLALSVALTVGVGLVAAFIHMMAHDDDELLAGAR